MSTLTLAFVLHIVITIIGWFMLKICARKRIAMVQKEEDFIAAGILLFIPVVGTILSCLFFCSAFFNLLIESLSYSYRSINKD